MAFIEGTVTIPQQEIRRNVGELGKLLTGLSPRTSTSDPDGSWAAQIAKVEADNASLSGPLNVNQVRIEAARTYFIPESLRRAMFFNNMYKMTEAELADVIQQRGFSPVAGGTEFSFIASQLSGINPEDIYQAVVAETPPGLDVIPTADQVVDALDNVLPSGDYTVPVARVVADLTDTEVETLADELGWAVPKGDREAVLIAIGKRLDGAAWKDGKPRDAQALLKLVKDARKRHSGRLEFSQVKILLEDVYLNDGKELLLKLNLKDQENAFVQTFGSLLSGDETMDPDGFKDYLKNISLYPEKLDELFTFLWEGNSYQSPTRQTRLSLQMVNISVLMR